MKQLKLLFFIILSIPLALIALLFYFLNKKKNDNNSSVSVKVRDN